MVVVHSGQQKLARINENHYFLHIRKFEEIKEMGVTLMLYKIHQINMYIKLLDGCQPTTMRPASFYLFFVSHVGRYISISGRIILIVFIIGLPISSSHKEKQILVSFRNADILPSGHHGFDLHGVEYCAHYSPPNPNVNI